MGLRHHLADQGIPASSSQRAAADSGGRQHTATTKEGAKTARHVETGEDAVPRQSDTTVCRHDDKTETAGDIDQSAHYGSSLGLVAVEERSRCEPLDDTGYLPGEIDRILHSAVHALSCEGRHQVSGVAGEKPATVAPPIRDAGVKCVDRLPLDSD